MQQFILTILIISNLSVGVEVATDYEDTWLEFVGGPVSADTQSNLVGDGDGDPDAEKDCDHCCHGTGHFAGAVAACVTLAYLRASSAIVISDSPIFFTSLPPPTPPPNV